MLAGVSLLEEIEINDEIPPPVVKKIRQVVPVVEESFKRALKGGVNIAFGTDSGVSSLAFGHLDYDLQLLVEVGFTPAEALAAATSVSAAAIGMSDSIGTIEVGKAADLTAFAGDPTQDVMAFSRVSAVFQGGVRVL